MTRDSKAVTQYLERYSTLKISKDAETRFLPRSPDTRLAPYHQALVIPAFDESPEFLDRLAKLPVNNPTLIIVVINCPAYAGTAAIRKTLQLSEYIRQHLTIENVSEGVTFGQLNSGLDVLSLDITTDRKFWMKPLQSGVGFARKVGMDVAVTLWRQGRVLNPWVLSSDADACWPADYFSSLKLPAGKGAITLNYRHQRSCTDASISTAGALYELSLRYYVLGLRWAESPWAYHTVGSVLGIHCESYCEVRGFPVREAGEDFYVLNKIAKTAAVHCPKEPLLRLSDRISDRVPFGTGPAVKRINQERVPEQKFVLYAPDTFRLLKQWHDSIPGIAQQIITKTGTENTMLEKQLPEALLAGLQALGMEKALSHCRQQAKTEAQVQHHLWHWFDGFRTLKLIHWLRDHGLASISYNTWRNDIREKRIEWLDQIKDASEDPGALNQALISIENNTLPFTGGLK